MAAPPAAGAPPAPRVAPGREVEVVVPGSSANLGPGFDAVGLALGVHDAVRVAAAPAREPGAPTARVEVRGQGEGRIADGEANLLVRSVRAALAAAGAAQPDLRVASDNGVPHGRGVGSSAAAVAAGVLAASALLEEAAPALDAQGRIDVACALEGHADNAAASLLGGLTLGWREGGPAALPGSGRWRAVRLEPHPGVRALLCLPAAELSTARARAMLPLHVPHGDAAHAAGRAALLVEALTRTPSLLLAATEDRLHQAQRSAAMPETWALLGRLRAAGHAAVVSGAGPSLLVLCPDDGCAGAAAALLERERGWRAASPGVAREGARVRVLRG